MRNRFFFLTTPPFLHPVVLFFSGLDYRPAYLCFALFLFLLVAASLPSLGFALKQNGWSRTQVFVTLAGVLLFEPLFISVLKGQDSALLLRIAPWLSLGLIHTIGWCLFVAALAGLCVLWGLSKLIGYRHIALAVTLSLFAAPHLHYHDLALLAVPLIGLGIAGVAAGRLTAWRAAALPMTVSVILLFSEFWDPVRFTVPYLLMAVLPAATWWYEKVCIQHEMETK